MMWKIIHRANTISTNLDARAGAAGDVFTADYQTAGRGRLDHRWISPPKTNLMMSAVVSVAGLEPERVATLPLVAGLAVARALELRMRPSESTIPPPASRVRVKWPNDVLIGGKKIAGILCERQGDNVIVGIGVNVGLREFPPDLAARATSLALEMEETPSVEMVRDDVLAMFGELCEIWKREGFDAVYPQIAARDFLKGRRLRLLQTDDDCAPLCGVADGILSDGSLSVGGRRAYAGEAHVEFSDD